MPSHIPLEPRKAPRPPELVIFDCDGVLVDSESIADRCFVDALAEIGLRRTPAELARAFRGRRLDDCLDKAEAWLGRPLPEGFAEQLQARTYAAFRSELEPISGVAEALAVIVCDRGLDVCVASSGEPSKIAVSLATTGLVKYFGDRVFSAREVPRGKPAPDLFLDAAARCGALPERSVVIEDSLPGVEAGLAAGMEVLAFVAEPIPDLPPGVSTFTDMAELPGLLE